MINVNTLEAMLASIQPFYKDASLFCPMIDARRLEVYCLLANEDGQVIEPTHAKIIDENSFADVLSEHQIIFFGNGAMKCEQLIEHPNAIFIEGVTPNAKNIGSIAHSKYLKEEFVDVAYFEPYYLKDFRSTQTKAV